MKFTKSMAAELFWTFGRKEGTNKKTNLNHSRNIEMKEIIEPKVVIANTE